MYKCPNFSASSPTLTICLILQSKMKMIFKHEKRENKGTDSSASKNTNMYDQIRKNSNCVEKHK